MKQEKNKYLFDVSNLPSIFPNSHFLSRKFSILLLNN